MPWFVVSFPGGEVHAVVCGKFPCRGGSCRGLRQVSLTGRFMPWFAVSFHWGGSMPWFAVSFNGGGGREVHAVVCGNFS